jgi:nucleoside-triphosphatase THEP1
MEQHKKLHNNKGIIIKEIVMGKRIDPIIVEKIVSLFKTDMNDGDIAGEFNVSVSYVNKLRNNYKNFEENTKPSLEKEFVVVEDTSAIDEIDVLELKINSLKQTLKWYEELLSIKKEKFKK